ncbi:NAD-dependent epimerase [Paenibacillus baekrokdamisoli]|uniref:NAD-dependent epimerase n=1 Tax=Paenibacillus baekrokdamisoli TaxID=1712516 RepID=A0A3G9JCL6_9BACL|nr:NAD-dependent epimerase [Paenibacillus baekrokdamisoli]MBB3068275.1 UDP-glucuronate 4-epimerase [Paenibacillus baekrokdamisoli]BBH22683.1 NAD-dependent epimerase [Paenibacillus baekrokdamisoli]
MKSLLVTGSAGFIGFHAARRWLAEGGTVIGYDNLNDYYDPSLKQSRLKLLQESTGFTFVNAALEDRGAMNAVFEAYKPDAVLHLAAQAGVRHSLLSPHAYVDSNVTGFLNVLEACRSYGTSHLLYGSSSSVYGANTAMPFSVSDHADHPLSLYAATKKANELMAHSYSHLFQIPTTGLRFFTVYGPWGRPDMALFTFTKSIVAGEPITVFNKGQMKRDFTYIDDIIEGIIRLIPQAPQGDKSWKGDHPNPAVSYAPYRIHNIGSGRPVELMKYIEVLERSIGRKAIINLEKMQPGDMLETYADVESLRQEVNYEPRTSIEEGIPRFVEWYLSYYGVQIGNEAVR